MSMFAKLGYGTRFRKGDQEYEIRKVKESDEFEVYNKSYDTLELISLKEILVAFNEKDESKRLIFHQGNVDSLKEAAKWDLDLYDPEQKQEMNLRYAIIEPFLRGAINDVKSYLQEYPKSLLPGTISKISPATFYRLLEKYRRGGSKIALIPLARGPKSRRISDIEMTKICKFIKEIDKKAETKFVRDKWLLYHDEIKKDNLFLNESQQIPLMKESTFRRVFKEIQNPYLKNREIMGIAQADLYENGVRGSIISERPLQYVELDWTPLDYIIVNFDTDETFRPVILHAVDKYSDEPLGYQIIFKQQPNAGDWKQLLLHVMLPKTGIKEMYPKVVEEWSGFGVPENIILDNASVNDCTEVEEVCGVLEIGFIFNEKGSGHQKGTIENALGRINRIFSAYAGTTFSNNDERGQYNSRKKACVNIKGLHHMLHVTLVDLVANKYNRGVGAIPEELWKTGLEDARVQRKLPYQREYLELLFASEVEERALNKKGIELHGEFYYSEEVNQLRLRIDKEGKNNKVRIRHGIDLRRIYVFDEFNKRYLVSNLKQSSRLAKHKIDQKYPVHMEHLRHLCTTNNHNAIEFLENQQNVTHGLKALEELVNEGKNEYSKTRRRRRMSEAQNATIVSAVTGSSDRVSQIPENPNIIIVNKDARNAALEVSNQKEKVGNIEKMDAGKISKTLAYDDIDLETINSNWSVGRQVT